MKWATRANCHVDRAACAWLIRRFIDRDATFVFVDDPEDVPADATPFDMRGVELSHRGGDCSFETFLRHYELDDPVLWDVARIVHEADLADERYDAPEAAGLDTLIRGLSLVHDDPSLLDLAGRLFDGLYEYRRPRDSPRPGAGVKWITRERPKTDRIACPWPITTSTSAIAVSSSCRCRCTTRSTRGAGVKALYDVALFALCRGRPVEAPTRAASAGSPPPTR